MSARISRIYGRNDFFTYKLVKPNGVVFYIGMACACWGKKTRFQSHLSEARCGGTSPKCQVIREILADREEVGYVIDRENLPYAVALDRECELVRYYGRANLTNKTDGGKGANGRVYTSQELVLHRVRVTEWWQRRKAKVNG